jgi:hypothetical protein
VSDTVAPYGPDDQGNLRIYCSACHAIVNWIRTYFGHYHVPASQPVDADAEL